MGCALVIIHSDQEGSPLTKLKNDLHTFLIGPGASFLDIPQPASPLTALAGEQRPVALLIGRIAEPVAGSPEALA